MHAMFTPRRRKLSGRPSSAARCSIESLERRTLLSAVWSTVDDFEIPGTSGAKANGMAPDGAGGVYAVGGAYDSSTHQSFGFVRHKAAGSSVWQTLATVPSVKFQDVAVDAHGAVYIDGTMSGPYD